MRPSEYIPNEAWLDERVEAYLDGELPPEEAARFKDSLAGGIGRDELLLARRIRSGLRVLPQPACPPEITEAVLQRVRTEIRMTWWRRVDVWLLRSWGDVLRPALVTASLIAVVVSAALLGRPAREPAASQAQVEQALAEAKWALALVSKAGRQTGSSVRDEVLQPHVIRPVRHAVGTVIEEQ